MVEMPYSSKRGVGFADSRSPNSRTARVGGAMSMGKLAGSVVFVVFSAERGSMPLLFRLRHDRSGTFLTAGVKCRQMDAIVCNEADFI
jgi:hypothetical protein